MAASEDADPSTRGLFQFLPPLNWPEWQIAAMNDYMRRRYIHLTTEPLMSWYDVGGLLPTAVMPAVNETGAPEVVLTDDEFPPAFCVCGPPPWRVRLRRRLLDFVDRILGY